MAKNSKNKKWLAIQNKGSCAIECNEREFGDYFKYSYAETVSKGATDACTFRGPCINRKQ